MTIDKQLQRAISQLIYGYFSTMTPINQPASMILFIRPTNNKRLPKTTFQYTPGMNQPIRPHLRPTDRSTVNVQLLTRLSCLWWAWALATAASTGFGRARQAPAQMGRGAWFSRTTGFPPSSEALLSETNSTSVRPTGRCEHVYFYMNTLLVAY